MLDFNLFPVNLALTGHPSAASKWLTPPMHARFLFFLFFFDKVRYGVWMGWGVTCLSFFTRIEWVVDLPIRQPDG